MSLDLAFLTALTPDAARMVAHSVTGKRHKSAGAARQALEQAFGDPVVLADLVHSLPDACRAYFAWLCEAQGFIDANALAGLGSDLFGAENAARAQDMVKSTGMLLVVPSSHDAVVLRPLAQAMQPLWDAWWRREHRCATVAADSSIPNKYPAFATQVLLAHLQLNPLRLTQDRCIYARDRDLLSSLFPSRDETWSEIAVVTLQRLGALASGDGKRLEVRREALAGIQFLGETAWWLALHKKDLDEHVKSVLLYLMRRPAWHSRTSVLAHLGLTLASRPQRYARGSGEAAHTVLRRCEQIGLVETAEVNGVERVRLHPEAARALSGASLRANAALDTDLEAAVPECAPLCHVQPNFDVIVPPEVDITTLLALGQFCALRTCDVVATFAITRDSVRRGVALGITAQGAIESLQRASRFAVPDNVVRGISDFAGEIKTAYFFAPNLMVVEPRDVPHLRNVPKVFTPARAPGAFWVKGAGAAQRRLESLGFCVLEETPEKVSPGRKYEDRPVLLQHVAHLARELLPVQEAIDRVAAIPPPASCPNQIDRLCADVVAKPRQVAPKGATNAPEKLTELALSCDCPREHVGVVLEALPHASKAWWKTLKGQIKSVALAIRQGGTPARRLKIANDCNQAPLRQLLALAVRQTDPPLCGRDAILGAMEHRHDVFVWPLGGSEPRRFTPHTLLRRGSDEILAGHGSLGGEDRVFKMDEICVAWGPRTDASDLRHALEARDGRGTRAS